MAITYHWVQGHQDTTKAIGELSWPAQLNVNADELATDVINEQKHKKQPPKLIPLVQTSVYLIQGKTTFTSHEVGALRSSIPTKNIKKYLLKRHNWNEGIFTNIALGSYASAIRSLDANKHKFVVKLCNNWLPVGQRLTKYGNTYDHCPLCQKYESCDHVFNCKSRDKWRKSFLSLLD
jgi:hypothetical protein